MINVPGRIPIQIQPYFLILALLIGALNGQGAGQISVWMGVVFVSVMVHELGHALTAVSFGQTARITLTPFGGVTQHQGRDLHPWQDFLIVLNGPVFGYLLAAFCYFGFLSMGKAPQGLFAYALYAGWIANVVWSTLNLLPVAPLDGGRLLGIFLEKLFGARGLRWSYLFSTFLGGVLGALLMQRGQFVPGIILFMLAFESYRAWKSAAGIQDIDRDGDLQRLFRKGEIAFGQERFHEAENILEEVRQKSENGLLHLGAVQLLAIIAYTQGDWQKAYKLLQPFADDVDSDGLRLLHRLAFQAGDVDLVLRIAPGAYEVAPNHETAYINALAHARKAEVQQAVGWLRRSVEDGLTDLPRVLARKDFDLIRQYPEFQALVNEL